LKKKNLIHLTELTNNLINKKFNNIFVNRTFYKKKISQKFTNDFAHKNKNFFDLGLIFLSEKLNKIHSCKHNYNFWKIILGYYIHSMVNIIIDRMNYIENLNKKDVIILKKVSDRDYVTENIEDFDFSLTNDCFNNAIYYFLLKIKKNNNFKLVKKENLHLLAKIPKQKKNLNSKLKFKFKNFFRYFSFDKEVLFYNTNFKLIKNFCIYKKFNFFFNIEDNYNNSLNKNLRNTSYSNIKNKQEIFNYFLLKFIPKAYLENFKYLFNNKLFRILSKNTKIVITENAHICDEEFKFWLAKNNDKIKNIKLVQFQAGAGYNYLKNEGTMAFRSSIADYLLSWGKKNNYKKQKQIYIGYPHYQKVKHNLNNKILYVSNELPRYLRKNASIPEGQKFIEHINLHEFFFKNLSKDISEKIYFKPYFHNHGWNIMKNIKKINTHINIEKRPDIKKLYNEYCFFINATPTSTFYETLYYNLPNIVIFSRDLWEFDRETNKIFNLLRENNIYFDDYKKAANFLNMGIKKILQNWNSINTQKAVKIFKENFISENLNYNRTLEKAIKKIKKKLLYNN